MCLSIIKTSAARFVRIQAFVFFDGFEQVLGHWDFVQAGQLPDVLPVLKANRSQYFVFVSPSCSQL